MSKKNISRSWYICHGCGKIFIEIPSKIKKILDDDRTLSLERCPYCCNYKPPLIAIWGAIGNWGAIDKWKEGEV